MSINVKTNPPLLRELRQMGLLTADAAPKVSGPFKLFTQIFAGDTSGAYKKLDQETLAGGACSAYYIQLEGTSSVAAYSGNLTEDTHYSVDGTTFTFLADYTGKSIIFTYAY